MKINGIFMSTATIVKESPFMASYSVMVNRDIMPMVLTGDLGRALVDTPRAGDEFSADAEVVKGERLGLDYDKVIAVRKIVLPFQAQKGRNINIWG